MTASTSGPSTVSPASTLSLLTNLPITHPSFRSLLISHAPLSQTPSLPSSTLSKLLGRVNSAILSRENESERKAAWEIAREVLEQDVEGYVINQYGKGWVTAALGALTATSIPIATIISPVDLLATLIVRSAAYPSFERESIHPIMGKVAVTLSRLIERNVSEVNNDWGPILDLIYKVKVVLEHSPASFRPVSATIKQSLRVYILSLPVTSTDPTSIYPVIVDAPLEIRQAASNLIAALPNTAGKAQSPTAWGTATREAIGGIAHALTVITRDGFEEEPSKVTPPAAPSGLPVLPDDSNVRLQAALDWLEGFTEEAVALLRCPISRPVPVPIAQIVAAALRCLNLTLDTPTVAYVTPQHHAALLAALPRIWTTGLLLIGGLATASGDHLLPHLGTILDHSTWLTERTPMTMAQTHLQLLGFHRLIFDLYPPALTLIEYPTRLLRFCLSQYASILDTRPGVISSTPDVGSKRGKKRARGAEDGLIGGLEGREPKALSGQTVHIVVACLQLATMLHPTPLLSPSLLTFSMRLHLSLHLHLPFTPKAAFQEPYSKIQLQDTVSNVLQRALYITEGEQGTSRGWKTAILAVLDTRSETALSFLHPSLPPLHRPQPPLNALHYFTRETEEERKLRRELGYKMISETGTDEVEAEEGEDFVMEEEQTTSMVQPQPTLQRLTSPPRFSALPVSTPIPAATTSSISTIPQMAPDASAPATRTEIEVAMTIVRADEPVEPVLPVKPVKPVQPVEPFMVASGGKGKGRADVIEDMKRETVIQTLIEDDDEPLPELDSGSSDEEDEDEEEEV